MRTSIILASIVSLGCLLCGCDQVSPAAHSKGTVVFEITNLKKESDSKAFGGSEFKVKGVVSVKGDAFKDRTLMLLLKRKISFKNSGVTKDGEDSVLVKNGSGLIDAGVYFSAEDTKAIGAELSSANISWETVGYIALQPALVEVK